MNRILAAIFHNYREEHMNIRQKIQRILHKEPQYSSKVREQCCECGKKMPQDSIEWCRLFFSIERGGIVTTSYSPFITCSDKCFKSLATNLNKRIYFGGLPIRWGEHTVVLAPGSGMGIFYGIRQEQLEDS